MSIHIARCGASLAFLIAIAGCSNFLPQSGPSRLHVMKSAAHLRHAPLTGASLPYALVHVNAATTPILSRQELSTRFELPASDRRADGQIGVGDEIGVTIFEADSGGLFITSTLVSRSGNSVALPSQQVDDAGYIAVPFAGEIEVRGRTTAQVKREIEKKLSNRALDPQVMVSVLSRKSGAIDVLGDVSSATRFSLEPGGEHLLGAIARAGGARFPDYESYVMLHRQGQLQQVLLSDVAQDPSLDIQLNPGDSIYVAHRPRYFLALGATGQTNSLGPIDRRIPFGDTKLALVDALAKAGGLEDDRANARAVFIYRFENVQTLAALGISRIARTGDAVPTVYIADLSDPAGYFYASQFSMRPEDIIFVSNAPATDLAKFLSLILPLAYSSANFNSGFK